MRWWYKTEAIKHTIFTSFMHHVARHDPINNIQSNIYLSETLKMSYFVLRRLYYIMEYTITWSYPNNCGGYEKHIIMMMTFPHKLFCVITLGIPKSKLYQQTISLKIVRKRVNNPNKTIMVYCLLNVVYRVHF